MSDNRIYLASKSPRRRELLEQIQVDCDILQVEVPEIPQAGESAEDFAVRLAREKAQAGWSCAGRTRDFPVLGSDTVVVVDEKIIGKPADREQGLQILRSLSGRCHQVISAVSICQAGKSADRLSVNRVCFRELSDAEISAYWATGEPADKAGAYGIQGLGAVFIERIEGSYSGVMGLPLFETAALLAKFGVRVIQG